MTHNFSQSSRSDHEIMNKNRNQSLTEANIIKTRFNAK